MMRDNKKKVTIWVHPLFRDEMKICAAKNHTSIVQLSKKMAIDKKLTLEEDKKDEEIIRY
jgi:hypothetical protein